MEIQASIFSPSILVNPERPQSRIQRIRCLQHADYRFASTVTIKLDREGIHDAAVRGLQLPGH